MLKSLRTIPLLLLAALSLAGCASIFGQLTYPVTIDTGNAANVRVKIVNNNNVVIYDGMAPVTMPLPGSSGYFKKAYYMVMLSKEGYKPQWFTLSAEIQPWYFGNFVSMNLIGLLVIDPLTGAMWKLSPQQHSYTLMPDDEASTKHLQILTIDQVPEHLKNQLQPLKVVQSH